LLLDEMISPAIARELRARRCDVQAVKRDRPELEGAGDEELVQRMTSERRGLVTNDIADFQPIHDRVMARGDEHYGMVFTDDATLPRNRASIPIWVERLEQLLSERPDEAALRNRIWHLI
jgi:hypothetical protein